MQNKITYSKLSLGIFFVLVLVLVPVLSMPHASSVISDPLVPATGTLTRSITFPSLNFMGKSDSSLTESISWYQDGSTIISDGIGDSFKFTIPVPAGSTFTILQNSTMVDQKVTGPSLQYDIYWKPVQNSKGIADRYKFDIVGTSTNGAQLQFSIKTSENLVSKTNEIVATDQENSTAGLAIDWSDAISAGYQVSFDQPNSALDISVGNTFSIDPTILVTTAPSVSPDSSNYYEGERRIVNVGGNLFAFYYNGSKIVYRNSTDDGFIWSTPNKVLNKNVTLSTDNNRWTIGSTTNASKQYISIVYWYNSTSTNVKVNYTRGYVAPGSLISWDPPKTLLTLAIPSGHAGVNVAANEANDTNGNLFLAIRYWNGTSISYYHNEFRSPDGGNTFTATHKAADTTDVYRPELVLTRLANGNMLLVIAHVTTAEFNYYKYNSTTGSWTGATTSGSNMTTNTVKQISADSDNSNSPYVAYVTGNHTGKLMVARWLGNGTFNKFETADSTLSHSLPSITITRDNVIHVYTINSSKIWETMKVGSTWNAPSNPFGTTFNSPNDLTSGILYPVALWEEGTTSPYNLMFGEKSWHSSTGILIPLYVYPCNFQGIPQKIGCGWGNVTDSRNAYPHVPIIAVINPNNGPMQFHGQTTGDSNYINQTKLLQSKGITVLGYVATGYAKYHPYNIPKSNVTQWKTLYPSINGILFDEMGNNGSAASVTFYQNLTNWAKNNQGFTYTVGNPGTSMHSNYNKTENTLNVYENNYTLQTVSGFPSLFQPSPPYQFDKSLFSILTWQIAGSRLNQTYVGNMSNFVSYLYFTDNTGNGHSRTNANSANPWNTTSSYLNTLVSYLNLPSVSLSFQSLNDSNSNGTITGLAQEISQSGNLARNATTAFSYNATQGWKYSIHANSLSKSQNQTCNVLDYWIYNGTKYTNQNPITITSPTQNATVNVYYKHISTGCPH